MSAPDFTFVIKGRELKAEGDMRIMDRDGPCPILEAAASICRMVQDDVPKFGALDAAKGGSSPSSGSRRFKIVGNYLYAPVESTASFDSAEAARAENRKWTKEGEEKGMRWKGRVVPVENVPTLAPPAEETGGMLQAVSGSASSFRRIGWREAEKILGGRVNRRRGFWFCDNPEMMDYLMGGPVFQYSQWTTSCSGCHETEDGHNVGHYPWDDKAKCYVGAGCHECGYTGKVRDGMHFPATLLQNAEVSHRDRERQPDTNQPTKQP